MKYYAFTSNPEGFLEGWGKTFLLVPDKENIDVGWAFLQEVEFDPDAVDMDAVRRVAVDGLNAEMEEKRADFTAGMEGLQSRKERLLAIEHKP